MASCVDSKGSRWVLGRLLVLGALVLALSLAPAPSGLRPEAKNLAVLFLFAVTLWVSGLLPSAVTTLLVLLLQPLLGVATLPRAVQTFSSPVFFFVLAMFCLAAAVTRSGVHQRLALFLLARAGTDARRVLLALMMGTALLSTIMSDLPTAALFMAVSSGILVKMGATPGVSRFGKAVMVGIPIASFIGGIATPAGSSVNVLALQFIEQYGKTRVSFLEWMAFGVPMVLLLIPIAWWVIVRCHPPEMREIAVLADVDRERRALGPLAAREKKVLVVLGMLMTLWILGAWLPKLDVVLVALGGAAILFAPRVELLRWKEAERDIAWDAMLMIGAVTSLGAASVDTGLAGWVVEAALGSTGAWPLPYTIAFVSALTVVAHIPLPVAPVLPAVLLPPIMVLAQSKGQNPALLGLPVALTASCAFQLPLDPVSLVTYGTGYYRMSDMLIPGVILSVVWVILVTVITLILAPLVGAPV